ncbi:Uncharacterized protein TCM_011008 [Theobroma cacao]|uniref:Reverse transcriptase zinc-binding domain-containing protein n=1 Tax=Theobroma cacao TaxID=3641 RepID=A0A061EFJ0_THECC|nr:Uncharacterized protein TCM_011008 [Theobroma cacao]
MLNSLPLYCLSIFQASKGVIGKLGKLRRKWWWCHDTDDNALWRRLILEKYGANQVQRILSTSRSYRMLTVWRCITQLPTNDRVCNLMSTCACRWIVDPLDHKEWFHSIWKLSIPPKVQCFLWLAILDSIPIKHFLASRGVPLIGKFGALFFNGGIMVYGETFWSLWLERNEAVFSNKVWDGNKILFFIRSQKLLWIHACNDYIDEIRWWTEPLNSSIKQSLLLSRHGISWQSLGLDEFKFNVDDSAKGKPGPAKCGGS